MMMNDGIDIDDFHIVFEEYFPDLEDYDAINTIETMMRYGTAKLLTVYLDVDHETCVGLVTISEHNDTIKMQAIMSCPFYRYGRRIRIPIFGAHPFWDILFTFAFHLPPQHISIVVDMFALLEKVLPCQSCRRSYALFRKQVSPLSSLRVTNTKAAEWLWTINQFTCDFKYRIFVCLFFLRLCLGLTCPDHTKVEWRWWLQKVSSATS